MKERELHKLKRGDLLELLLSQSKDVVRQQEEIEQLKLKASELEETCDRLKGKLDEKDAQIEHLKSRLDAKDAQINGLKAGGMIKESAAGASGYAGNSDVQGLMSAILEAVQKAVESYKG